MTLFSSSQLDTLVNETIPASVPAGHTNAIVLGVDQTGAQVVAKFVTEQGRWAFEAGAQHTWAGENEVGAKVILSW